MISSIQEFIDEERGSDDDNEVNMKPHNRRRSIGSLGSLYDFDFNMDVGFRGKDQKHLSYSKAKLHEALTKFRHVEDLDTESAEPEVLTDGSVTFSGKQYSIVPTCKSSVGTPGCKCCKRPHEPSDFERLGVGVVLYFKFLKIMIFTFFFLTIISCVQFIIFENAGALKAELDGQEGLAHVAFLSMGNLGEGKTICAQESMGGTFKLFCPTGQIIGKIKEVHYGETEGMCECPTFKSAEEKLYGASKPPSLTDSTKCGTELPYLGRDPISSERCCSKTKEPSGKGNFTALKFRDNKYCKSSVASVVENGDDAACAAASFDAEEGTFAYQIVESACKGKEMCEIDVDDFTQWNSTSELLEKCSLSNAANCSFALGSVGKTDTFANCSSSSLKKLSVVALCFDQKAVVLGVDTTKEELWILLTLAEMAIAVVLLFVIWLVSTSQVADINAIDESVITLTDYSVMIPKLNCTHDPEFAMTNKKGITIVDTEKLKRAMKDHLEEYLTSRPAVAIDDDLEEELNSGEEDSQFKIKIHDIVFGKGDGKVIKLRKKRGALVHKIEHEKGHLKKLSQKGKSLDHTQEKINKHLDKLKSIDEKIEQEKQKANVNTPVCAYITFARNEGRLRMIDNFPNSNLPYYCQPCCKGKRSMLLGKYRYWVDYAPEPENIWWENLAVSNKSRGFRVCLSTLITLALILASIGGISYVKGFNTKLARMYPPVDCKSLTLQYGGEISKVDVELDELQLDRIDRSVTGNSSIRLTVQTEYELIRKPTKDNVFQCFCQNVLLNPRDSIQNYVFKPKKDLVMANITKEGQWNYTTPYLDTHPDGDWCVKYAEDYLQITGLTFGSVVLVLAINSVLKQCMKRLVKFERPKSKGDYSMGLANKLFIVQLINTALVVLIVNGNLETYNIGGSSVGFDLTFGGTLFSGDHSDFNKSWFTTVGTSIIITMIINLATPLYSPVGNCVFRGLGRVKDRAKVCCCCGERQYSKKVTQTDYDELWDGGEFELPARYGAIQMVFWVTMIYGSGLPILYPLGFGFFFIAFWVDKWAITKLYNAPAQSDGKLAKSVTDSMVYGVLLHVIVACWKYSNTRLFEGVNIIKQVQEIVGLDMSAVEDAAQMVTCGGGGFALILSRVTISVPHLFALSLMITIYLVSMRMIYPMFGTVLLGLFPCCKGCCDRPEEDTELEITAAVESGFVGPQSYDLSQNREYAKAFGLDTQDVSLLAAGDLEAHDSGTGGTTVEMVQLSGETEVTVTG